MYRLAALFLLFLALATPTEAQGPFGTSPYQPPVDDKTGTNPLNLQQQIDISNAYLTLDPLYLNSTTYRHAVALFHRRLRLAGLLPIGVSNLTGTKEWGLGDVGADVEWIPWLAKGNGLVAGLRTTWNTATAAGLGYGGTHTLMPYAQYVRQTSPRLLLAPFFGYRFGVTGEEFAPTYKDSLIGVTAVWRATNRTWIATTPQVVFDLEHDRTYGDVGGEVGVMVSRRFSTYVRPSFGYGRSGEKPYDWAVTAGLRFVP